MQNGVVEDYVSGDGSPPLSPSGDDGTSPAGVETSQPSAASGSNGWGTSGAPNDQPHISYYADPGGEPVLHLRERPIQRPFYGEIFSGEHISKCPRNVHTAVKSALQIMLIAAGCAGFAAYGARAGLFPTTAFAPVMLEAFGIGAVKVQIASYIAYAYAAFAALALVTMVASLMSHLRKDAIDVAIDEELEDALDSVLVDYEHQNEDLDQRHPCMSAEVTETLLAHIGDGIATVQGTEGASVAIEKWRSRLSKQMIQNILGLVSSCVTAQRFSAIAGGEEDAARYVISDQSGYSEAISQEGVQSGRHVPLRRAAKVVVAQQSSDPGATEQGSSKTKDGPLSRPGNEPKLDDSGDVISAVGRLCCRESNIGSKLAKGTHEVAFEQHCPVFNPLEVLDNQNYKAAMSLPKKLARGEITCHVLFLTAFSGATAYLVTCFFAAKFGSPSLPQAWNIFEMILIRSYPGALMTPAGVHVALVMISCAAIATVCAVMGLLRSIHFLKTRTCTDTVMHALKNRLNGDGSYMVSGTCFLDCRPELGNDENAMDSGCFGAISDNSVPLPLVCEFANAFGMCLPTMAASRDPENERDKLLANLDCCAHHRTDGAESTRQSPLNPTTLINVIQMELIKSTQRQVSGSALEVLGTPF